MRSVHVVYSDVFKSYSAFPTMLCNLGNICCKMDPRPPFHLYKKSLSSWKNTTFVFNRKIRHFPDLRVTQDFLCIEPEVLPTTYKKISIVTK